MKSLKSNFSLTQPETGTTQVETTIVFPDRMKADVQTPQGTISIVVTADSSFMSAGAMGTRDMPTSRRNESLEQIRRDLIYVTQHLNDPAFSFTASGSDKTGKTELAIVDVSGPGTALRWFVDPQTGKIVRETYKAMGQSGLVDSETDFSDWKNVEGLNLPFHRDNKQEGKDSSTVQFSSVQINPAVDPTIFERPPVAPAQ